MRDILARVLIFSGNDESLQLMFLQQLTEISKTLGSVDRVGTFRAHDGCGREK